MITFAELIHDIRETYGEFVTDNGMDKRAAISRTLDEFYLISQKSLLHKSIIVREIVDIARLNDCSTAYLKDLNQSILQTPDNVLISNISHHFPDEIDEVMLYLFGE
jgi:hypothetical protein